MSLLNTILKSRAISAITEGSGNHNTDVEVARHLIFSASCRKGIISGDWLERHMLDGVIPPEAIKYAEQQEVEIQYH